jgi:hypothetical protein
MELVQDAKNMQQVRQALRLVAPLPIVWPTETDCQRALSDFTAYHLSHGTGILDALIAHAPSVWPQLYGPTFKDSD